MPSYPMARAHTTFKTSMSKQYWILKTEPETFSLQQLERDGKTPWNGVRNFQARNFIATMKPGDIALIYHSGKNPCIVGRGTVMGDPYPDHDPKRAGQWLQVDVKYYDTLKKPIPLEILKKEPKLKDLKLFKQSRLSVIPIEEKDYKTILALL